MLSAFVPGRPAVLLSLTLPAFMLILSPAKAALPAPSVAIRGFAFVPQTVTVTVGTTITWTNEDEDPHTVVANDKSFHSVAMDTDDRFSYTFTTPGEFAYFCSLHPHMTGKVIVKGR